MAVSPDSEARSMVDKDTRSNGRTWMDLNLGPKRQNWLCIRVSLKPWFHKRAGNTVSCQCFDPRIGQKDPPARYALLGHFLYNIDGSHATIPYRAPPFLMLILNLFCNGKVF